MKWAFGAALNAGFETPGCLRSLRESQDEQIEPRNREGMAGSSGKHSSPRGTARGTYGAALGIVALIGPAFVGMALAVMALAVMALVSTALISRTARAEPSIQRPADRPGFDKEGPGFDKEGPGFDKEGPVRESWSGAVRPSTGEALFFRFEGPNDGEPLERGRLVLSILTNYAERGEIQIQIEGITVSRLTYLPPREIGLSGPMQLYQTVDLRTVGTWINTDLLAPDYGPLTVSATLHGPDGTAVTRVSWATYAGRPWLKFVVVDPEAEELENDPLADYWNLLEEFADEDPRYDYGDDPLIEFWDLLETLEDRRLRVMRQQVVPDERIDPTVVPAGSIGVVPHFRLTDDHYYLTTALDGEAARLAPDHPAFEMASEVLSSGPVLEAHRRKQPVFFEAWYRDAHRELQFLVLWAHDSSSGEWERSLVHSSR